MSYYDICAACRDKHFIRPGTQGAARHEGIGYESDGSRERDAAARDADHQAVPIALCGEVAQRKMFGRALEIIREQAPAAVVVWLETSDQDSYGFVLRGVADAAGQSALTPELEEAVNQEINDLEWDGVVGEDKHGLAAIRL